MTRAPPVVATAPERALLRWLLRCTRVETDEVARRAGCSKQQLARFLAGAAVPDPDALQVALERALVDDSAVVLSVGAPRLFELMASSVSVIAVSGASSTQLRALARELGMRWGAYRKRVGARPIDAELERVLVAFEPAGARRRRRAGDLFEHVVREKMRAAGFATVDALAAASGHSRRAVDGWLRGHRPITAIALARICRALGSRDAAHEAAAFRLAARLAAAVQDFQLRSGLDVAIVRATLRELVEAARRAEAEAAGLRAS